MRLVRPKKENDQMKAILRYGGYSVVLPKMPTKFVRAGFLQSIDMVAARIQRAWFTSKGNYAQFIIAAARRAKEEHMQMLNDNASIIQHNFRGHLWNLLQQAAIEHNRARRITRAFRHYQYRVTVTTRLEYRLQRSVRKIQKAVRHWIARKHIAYLFKARKIFIKIFRRKELEGAVCIQRQFRAYKERERIKREEFIALVKKQRQNAELVFKNICFIQKVWRKNLRSGKKSKTVGNRFPRHVYLVIWRHVRRQRAILYRKAYIIQKIARPYILRVIERQKQKILDSVNIIWRFAKSYLLKLAIWDRVKAVQRTERIAANVMKYALRRTLFRRKIKLRYVAHTLSTYTLQRHHN